MAPAGADLGDRADALARDPDLAVLWRAAHARLEATGGTLAGAAVTLRDLSDAERRALDLLLGTRRRAVAPRVGLEKLDRLLVERADASLLDIVTASVGPVRDRPAERADLSADLVAAWAQAEAHPAVVAHPALSGWLVDLRRTGRITRLGPGGHDELAAALDVLARLPSPSPIPRSALAARVLGDAHALDDDRPTGRLVLAALDVLGPELSDTATTTTTTTTDAAALAFEARATTVSGAATRRDRWAAAGVLSDGAASTVLTLALAPEVVGPLTDGAARWADGGSPLPLPLAAVTAEAWSVGRRVVHVCENPTVLAVAAAELDAVPPLVCVEGNPSLAARHLLDQLSAGGAELRYHGDFGSGGVAIGNLVIGQLGARPWRFDAAAHAEALDRLGAHTARLRPLAGAVPAAVWDPQLAPSIETCGVEVEEEQVLDLLLSDLRAT